MMPDQPHDPAPATPAHLPALLPPTTTLLQRTQTTLGLLRDVVQESSAEYWYERGKKAIKAEHWAKALYAFRQCVHLDKSHWKGALQLAIAVSIQQVKFDEVPTIIIHAYDQNCLGREVFFSELSKQYWDFLRGKLDAYKIIAASVFDTILSLAIVSWAIDEPYSVTVEILSSIRSLYKEQTSQSVTWHRLSGWVGDGSGYDSTHYYDHALELDPINSYILLERGYTKAGSAFADTRYSSILDYSAAIELNPLLVEAYAARGRIKYKFDDFNGAVEDYSYAIGLAPYGADNYNRRGKALYALEKYEQAISDYNQAIQLAPSNASFYGNRAWAKRWLNDIGGANDDLWTKEQLERQ